MPNYRVLATLLIAFLVTAFVAVGSFAVLQLAGFNMESHGVGLPLLAFLAIFAGSVVKACTAFIYPRESAGLFVLGAVRFGSGTEAIFSGKAASWPFAKLVADEGALWIHTPWRTIRWINDDYLVLQRKRNFIGTTILLPAKDSSGNLPIVFKCFRNDLEAKLRALGFRFTK